MSKDPKAQFKEHLVGLIRSVRAALLAVFLVSSAGASAGEYSLAYAIEANGRNDVGKIETCDYDKPCDIDAPGLGLRISLSFIHADHDEVELYVDGPSGCCYSNDAIRTFYIEIKPGLLRVPIYQGRARRQNEFVQNKRFGVLYLAFSNLR
jgi:hypothetical protein